MTNEYSNLFYLEAVSNMQGTGNAVEMYMIKSDDSNCAFHICHDINVFRLATVPFIMAMVSMCLDLQLCLS